MNSEESEYTKCGEIFIASEHDYTFLCYYCNELFYEFIEFKTHSLTHLDSITPNSEPKIQKDKKDSKLEILEFPSEIADYSIYNEDEDNNFHKNDSVDSNCQDLGNDIDIQSEKNDVESTNAEDDSIDNISNKLENANKEAENSTEELYCLHCKALFKNEFHDIKRCSEIQQKIKEYNGNFLELLKHGILSCKCRRYFKNHISLYEHHLKENHCFPKKVCQICKFYIFMNSKIDSSKQNINPDNKIIKNKNKDENKIDDKLEDYRHTRTVFRYKCPICDRLFQTNFQKHKHMKIHVENRHFSCFYEGCDEKFKYKSFLKLHEKTHLPNNFQCEICGSNFKTKSNMFKHQRIAHTDPKSWPHQCDICDRRFSQSYRLNEHKRIHTGEKPFGCDICSKFFRKQSNLKEHKKLHSEERKYVCRFCGKSFKQAAGYWGHMKRHPVVK